MKSPAPPWAEPRRSRYRRPRVNHTKEISMSIELTRRAFGKAALAAPLLVQGLPARAAADATGNQVHRFEQTQPFPVNAYIVEGEKGVVIVDGTLTVSSSSVLRRRAD